MAVLKIQKPDGSWDIIPAIPGPVGPEGPQGIPGAGFPTGGNTDQVLVKVSDDDYDTEWKPVSELSAEYNEVSFKNGACINGTDESLDLIIKSEAGTSISIGEDISISKNGSTTRLSGIADPINDTDASNKKFTVDSIQAASEKIILAEGIVGGTAAELTLSANVSEVSDGACVRIKTVYPLKGIATLKVGTSSAKRIRTASRQNPSGILENTWLELVFNSSEDAYILAGGTSGSGSSSGSIDTLNINLLEEVDNMKYCKVITNDYISEEPDISAWLAMAPLHGCCETVNYTWYARVLQNSPLIEFMRIDKVTKEASFSTYTMPTTSVAVSLATNSSYWARQYTGTLHLAPIRNSDYFVYFTFFHGWALNATRGIWLSGCVSPSGSVIHQYYTTDSSNGPSGNVAVGFYGCINGAYNAAGNFLMYALPSPWGMIVIKINLSNNGVTTQSVNYGLIYVMDDASAYIEYYIHTSQSTATTVKVQWGITIDAWGTWGTTTSLGLYRNYQTPYDSSGSLSAGFYIDDQTGNIVLMYKSQYPGYENSGQTTNIHRIQVHPSNLNQATWSVVTLGPAANMALVSFIPSILSRPIIIIRPATSKQNSAEMNCVYYDLDRLSAIRGYNAGSTYIDSYLLASNTPTYTSTFGGEGCTDMYVDGVNALLVDINGNALRFNITNNPASDIVWEAPEDGIYKFIAVGGGAAGDVNRGGGAGYLKIGTKQLSAGDTLNIKLGAAGLYAQQSALQLLSDSFRPTPTVVGDFLVALPASGNQGGATGAATASGGGAGGYDLVTYGGAGMNYNASLTASAPVKDRNGGLSANTGAVTSGDGYGAGGGMNQSGKAGCVVILS